MSEVKRMWEGGPLREIDGQKRGRYVCAKCKEPTNGVYGPRDGWVGACCRPERVPRAFAGHRGAKSDRQEAMF